DFVYSGSYPDPYFVGVVFGDKDGDKFYTPGEGLAGVKITFKRNSDGKVWTAYTFGSGGYRIAVNAGTFTVTASGGSLTTSITKTNIHIGSDNKQANFLK